MPLGREKILEFVKNSNLIENFDIDCLEGAGYDLRVWNAYRIRGHAFIGVKERKNPHVEKIEYDIYTLKPGEYILVETLERVNMPKNLLARILPRSSIFRYGCSLFTAIVDPGYEGSLTIGMKNLSESEFRFERGSRIAQIVFERVDGMTSKYRGRYQGGNVI